MPKNKLRKTKSLANYLIFLAENKDKKMCILSHTQVFVNQVNIKIYSFIQIKNKIYNIEMAMLLITIIYFKIL